MCWCYILPLSLLLLSIGIVTAASTVIDCDDSNNWMNKCAAAELAIVKFVIECAILLLVYHRIKEMESEMAQLRTMTQMKSEQAAHPTTAQINLQVENIHSLTLNMSTYVYN